ncbi:trypsin [Aeromicrobium sp. A1-2]|uniref:S1C family serine protease n=1 Tax=Aeromicrobium sp. A1-2 TaxID=2107713 RepID=UPI000E5353B4|nr:trypsin-like peptidase domain-containing protein [Aeromicrobium sp. A1-2]AXT86577.1 trypsin [Aeromicrobium sp. A1-2]
MTDSKDPFADRPYVPPTERDGASDSAPSSPEPVAPAADATHEAPQPTRDPSTEHGEPPAPEPIESPTGSAPMNSAPTDSAPTDGPAQASTTPSDRDSEPTVVVASSPVPPPAADAYTHRYPADGSTAAGPAAAQTDSFVHDQTIAFPVGSIEEGGEPPAKKPKKKRRAFRVLVGSLALILLAGAAGYGGAYLQDQTQDDATDSSTVSSLDPGTATNTSVPTGAVEQVAAKVLPSVVQINVKGATESGSGTGIIISSDGEILTNNHVTAVAGTGGIITVAFNDGSNTTATIVGADPKTDLAVIKAKGKTGLTPATLGTSADLQVGQEVVAIGSPFGLESTVTQGIVSALNRPVTSSDGSSDPAKSNTFPAIQTDAAINPGNSGGPLVDIKGNVIGINSAIKASGSTEGGSIGLGFAIPIDLAKNVSKFLVKGETVEHAQIGVSVRPAVGDDGITGVGALIGEVTSGGAGAKAGLKKDDIITAVNGNLIPSSEALVASVRGYQPGEKITVSYRRDGKQSQVEVTLDSDGGTTTG